MSRKHSISRKSTPKGRVSPFTPRENAILTEEKQALDQTTTANTEDPAMCIHPLDAPAANTEDSLHDLGPLTPSKSPFEEVPFRNVDYTALTFDDLIQRSARRVKIGPNGEEVQETWLEVKMKINSRVNSERKSVYREENKREEEEKQENVVMDLNQQFGNLPDEPAPTSPMRMAESPQDSKSVQTDDSPQIMTTPDPAPAKPPRRSARLAEKRIQRTQATPKASVSPIPKRKRPKSRPVSVKRPKRGN